MMGASMLQQGEQQRQQRAADKAAMMANASAMEYSPWTGMQTQMQGPKATGGLGGVLGAGAQGYMMGSMFNQANAAQKLQEDKLKLAQDKFAAAQSAPKSVPHQPGFSTWEPMTKPNLYQPQLGDSYRRGY